MSRPHFVNFVNHLSRNWPPISGSNNGGQYRRCPHLAVSFWNQSNESAKLVQITHSIIHISTDVWLLFDPSHKAKTWPPMMAHEANSFTRGLTWLLHIAFRRFDQRPIPININDLLSLHFMSCSSISLSVDGASSKWHLTDELDAWWLFHCSDCSKRASYELWFHRSVDDNGVIGNPKDGSHAQPG
jgi:hypothetical protein